VIINRGRYEDFLACHRMYFWRYVQGINKARTIPAFRIGAAVHKFLEVWYGGQQTSDGTVISPFDKEASLAAMKLDFKRSLHQISEIPLAQQAEDQLIAQGEILCRDYVSKYGTNEPGYKWIATEVQGDAALLRNHVLRFRIDSLVAYDNKLWVGEHKTAARFGEAFLNSFNFKHQIIAYAYGAAKELQKKDPTATIAGVIVNLLRKPTQNITTDFDRVPVMVTAHHMRNMLHSFSRVADDISSRDPSDPMDWEQYTQNCYGCDFYEICAYNADPTPPLYVKRATDYVDLGFTTGHEDADDVRTDQDGVSGPESTSVRTSVFTPVPKT
jgi:hypothetical protein